ncbi:septum formation family protein [uncultured Demequina sp.]|uniref:septum formation family protein n=1 Tax=uncultured Demequina sp. TaxID=693499 RepID=UPI0025D3874A|nr:septum formation family protein [uncultured Demequina sp.]
MRAPLAITVIAALGLAGCSLLDPSATVEELQLTVGECLNEASVTEEGEQEIGVMPVVDCADVHFAEVFHTEELTVEDYPEDISDLASEVCYLSFEDYLGIPYEESIYYFTATYPTSASWNWGDRQIACLVVGDVGEQLTGSVAGSAA